MNGPIFLDTNLLIYAMDPETPQKRDVAADLLRRSFATRRLVVSPQILNECYRVLVHKKRLVPRQEARDYLGLFMPVCVAPLDAGTHRLAYGIEDRHGLSWWDCVAIASALQAQCSLFVSEDLHDGLMLGSMAIVNPFGSGAKAVIDKSLRD